MKFSVLLMLTLTLQGCSTLSALDVIDKANPLSDDGGIDVNAQFGKNNSSREVKALGAIEQQNSSHTNNDIQAATVNQVTNNKDSIWLIIAIAVLAGFVIPSPSEILASIKSKFNNVN